MSIQDIKEKINTYTGYSHLLWTGSIFGITMLIVGSICLILSAQNTSEASMSQFEMKPLVEGQTVLSVTSETVYASKSGTCYYYADCPGLKRIKTQNKISFAHAGLAEQAGYTKAARCH